MQKIRNFFLCYGFTDEQINPIRYDLVDITIESLQKFSLGLIILYVGSLFFSLNSAFFFANIGMIFCFYIFLLVTQYLKKHKNYALAELSIVLLLVSSLSIAIYDSTVLNTETKGIFFPMFMLLFAVMITGNPMAIDGVQLIMMIIYILINKD